MIIVLAVNKRTQAKINVTGDGTNSVLILWAVFG